MESQASCAELHRTGNDCIKPSRTAVDCGVATITRGSTECSTRLSCPITLSYLERLPIELLQGIFFESLNLNLPRASPKLCSALSSRYIKYKLFSYAFAQYNCELSRPQQAFTEKYTARPGQRLWAGQYPCLNTGRVNLCPYRINLQGDMLSVRWLTLDFLKEFIKDFYLNTVLFILRESSDWAVVDSEDGLTGVPSITMLADFVLRDKNMKLERRSCQNSRYRTLCVRPGFGWISVEEWEPRPSDGEAKLDILEIGYTRNATAHQIRGRTERLREETWWVPDF